MQLNTDRTYFNYAKYPKTKPNYDTKTTHNDTNKQHNMKNYANPVALTIDPKSTDMINKEHFLTNTEKMANQDYLQTSAQFDMNKHNLHSTKFQFQPINLGDKDIYSAFLTVNYRYKPIDFVAKKEENNLSSPSEKINNLTIPVDQLVEIFKPNITDIDKYFNKEKCSYLNLGRILPVKVELLGVNSYSPFSLYVICTNPGAANWNSEHVVIATSSKKEKIETKKALCFINSGRSENNEKKILFDHCEYIKSSFFSLFGCMNIVELEKFCIRENDLAWVEEGKPLFIYINKKFNFLSQGINSMPKTKYINSTLWVGYPEDIVLKAIAFIKKSVPNIGIMNLTEGLHFAFFPSYENVQDPRNYNGIDTFEQTKNFSCSITIRLRIWFTYPRTKNEEQEAINKGST